MMRTIDDLVADALSADEKEILRRIGPEPGLIGLTAGLFTGRLGWVNAVLMAVQALAFLAGAYAAYRFFLAEEVVAQLRWGLPAWRCCSCPFTSRRFCGRASRRIGCCANSSGSSSSVERSER
jgi:hypothetical protein